MPVQGLVRQHLVAFGDLLANDEAHVGESGEHHGEELARAFQRGWVGHAAVVNEVGAEQLVQRSQVMLALHFFDEAPDNGFVLLQ